MARDQIQSCEAFRAKEFEQFAGEVFQPVPGVSEAAGGAMPRQIGDQHADGGIQPLEDRRPAVARAPGAVKQ